MDVRNGRTNQENKRRVRTETNGTHRRGIKTQKNVGTKTFGGRQPNQVLGCKTDSISSCTKGLLGTFR